MMVVMLIVSIVLAAMAPVMTTKMKADRATKEATSIWRWIEDKTGIYFSTGGNEPVMIGQKEITTGDPSALLILNRDGGSRDHVLFKNRENILGRLSFTSNNGILLGSLSADGSIIEDSVAIGNSVNAKKRMSVAIGSGANTSGDNDDNNAPVAIGHSASSHDGIAIGHDAKASDGITIGVGAETSYWDAIAIGRGAKANCGIAIGFGAICDYDIDLNTVLYDNYKSVVVIGYKAKNNKNLYSTVLGANSQVKGEEAVAIGYNAEASRSSIAMGNGAKVSLTPDSSPITSDTPGVVGAIAIGKEAIAYQGAGSNRLSYSSIAIGAKAEAKTGAIAIGSAYNYDYTTHTTSAESYGVAMGVGAKAGDASVAIGALSETTSFDIAIGRGALAYGGKYEAGYVPPGNSTAIGAGAQAKSKNSTAIGAGAVADKANQIALGTAASTVYIPGNLVVGGNVVLANSKGSNIYMRENTTAYSGFMDVQRMVRVAGTSDNFETEKDDKHTYEVDDIDENFTRAMLFELVDEGLSVGGFTISDKRLKYVGKESKDGLDKIRQLKIFNYTFKKDPSKEPRVGVIAQDLQKIFPNAVKKGKDGFLTIRMEDMFYAMVNAIKELDMKVTEILKQVQNDKKEIQALKNENRILKEQNKALDARLKALEAKIK